MAKNTKKNEATGVETTDGATEMPASDREARWKAHLERYEQANPAKYAAKLAAGEFDKVPDSFK